MDTVKKEVMEAYADCWDYAVNGNTNDCMKRRNLNFKASNPVSRDDALEIMSKAIPHMYNVFEANLLEYLPEDCQVILAREYSVCMYVDKITPEAAHKLGADELDKQANGWYRIWWD